MLKNTKDKKRNSRLKETENMSIIQIIEKKKYRKKNSIKAIKNIKIEKNVEKSKVIVSSCEKQCKQKNQKIYLK